MQEWCHAADRICKTTTSQDGRPVGRYRLIADMNGQVEEAASTLTAFLMYTQVFTSRSAYVYRFLHVTVDIECHINAPVDSLHVPHATYHNRAPSCGHWWL